MDSALCRRLKQTRFVLKGSEKVRISRILCAENGHAFSKEDGWWSRNRVPVYRTTMISEVSIPYMASTGLPGFLFHHDLPEQERRGNAGGLFDQLGDGRDGGFFQPV